MMDFSDNRIHREQEMEEEARIDNPFPLTDDERAKIAVLGQLLAAEACGE